MHKQKRWRYYCDFCKTSRGTEPSMTSHERGCTANPNRICGLHFGEWSKFSDLQCPLPKLIKILDGVTQDDIDFRLPMLREASGLWAEGCPACILAALRQGAPGIYSSFDFKSEMKKFWEEMNRERIEDY